MANGIEFNVVLVVEPADQGTDERFEKVLDHFFEAIDHHKKTGFPSKIRLLGYKPDGSPIYEKMEAKQCQLWTDSP